MCWILLVGPLSYNLCLRFGNLTWVDRTRKNISLVREDEFIRIIIKSSIIYWALSIPRLG